MKDDAVAADQGAGVSSADGGCPSMSAPCSPKASKAAGMAAEAATNARRRVQAGEPLLRSTVAAKTAPPAPRASKSVRRECAPATNQPEALASARVPAAGGGVGRP